MNRMKKYKNEAMILIICVIALTTTTMGLSYAVFFDIGTDTVNQSITTGSLTVEYGSSSSTIIENNILPVSDEVGLASEAKSLIYLQNNGTLDSTYNINIGFNNEEFQTYIETNPEAKLVPIEYIKIALFEYDNDTMQMNLVSDIMKMSELIISETNSNSPEETKYVMYTSNIEKMSSGNNAQTYAVKIWIDEFASEYIVDYNLFLELEIESTVTDSLLNYNINGTLLNSDGTNLVGANISLNNGYQKIITDENALFTLNNIRKDTYKLYITKDDLKYNCTFSFDEGDIFEIGDYLNTHTVTSGNTLQSIANTYSTTIKLIRDKNEFIDISDNITLTENTVLTLPNTQKIIGTTDTNIQADLKLESDGSCRWVVS